MNTSQPPTRCHIREKYRPILYKLAGPCRPPTTQRPEPPFQEHGRRLHLPALWSALNTETQTEVNGKKTFLEGIRLFRRDLKKFSEELQFTNAKPWSPTRRGSDLKGHRTRQARDWCADEASANKKNEVPMANYCPLIEKFGDSRHCFPWSPANLRAKCHWLQKGPAGVCWQQ